MEFNSFIFLAPEHSYSCDSEKERLIYIPRAKIINRVSYFNEKIDFKKESKYIPCLYIRADYPSNKLLIYLHGNAEDVGISEEFLTLTKSCINFHIIAIEYPGYGVYKGNPEATRIMQDAINVFDYIATECQWGEKNIVLLGRSIGCGPALQLAAMRNPFALVLISPYTSLKGIIKSHTGCLIAMLIKERFQNTKLIEYVKCPLFILHGKVDTLIPYSHSLELKENYKGKDCTLVLPEKMDHNVFSFHDDFISPLQDFLSEHGFETGPEGNPVDRINFPKRVLTKPKDFKELKELPLSVKMLRKII